MKGIISGHMVVWCCVLVVTSMAPAIFAADKTICIVGGGASGISAATELAEMNYEKNQIFVFEKNYKLGGKCDSVALGQETVEMGAILAAPTYKWVRHFADMVGHPLIPHAPITALTSTRDASGPTYLVQPLDKYYQIPSLMNPLNAGDNFRIFKAIKKYDALARKALNTKSGVFHSDIQEEFYELDASGKRQLKSFARFAQEQDLGIILPWFEVFVNSFGYLTLDNIPAIYVLDYVSNLGGYWAYLKGLAKTRRLHSGYSVLISEIADHYREKINVILGAAVTKIDRRNNLLIYQKNGKENEQHCTDFIIASEPGPIVNLFEEPSPFERYMQDNISYSPYRTLVVETTIPDGAYMLPKEAHSYKIGDVVLIANEFGESETKGMRRTLLYTTEDSDSVSRSSAEVLIHIKGQLARYGFKVGEIVKDEYGDEIHRVWPNYFPHFKEYVLDQVERQQGMRNTYYAGPAYNGFELVERAMVDGTRIAQEYFSDAEHLVPSPERFDSHRSMIGIPNWNGEQDKDYSRAN